VFLGAEGLLLLMQELLVLGKRVSVGTCFAQDCRKVGELVQKMDAVLLFRGLDMLGINGEHTIPRFRSAISHSLLKKAERNIRGYTSRLPTSDRMWELICVEYTMLTTQAQSQQKLLLAED
jgi:hypothetical protein